MRENFEKRHQWIVFRYFAPANQPLERICIVAIVVLLHTLFFAYSKYVVKKESHVPVHLWTCGMYRSQTPGRRLSFCGPFLTIQRHTPPKWLIAYCSRSYRLSNSTRRNPLLVGLRPLVRGLKRNRLLHCLHRH